MSEFGAEAKYGNHGVTNPTSAGLKSNRSTSSSTSSSCSIKSPSSAGISPWILVDFRSPTRNIPKLQDGYNRKGLISEDGKKKQAFELLKKTYKEHSVGKPE
jgi:beta-glucuronidase